MNKCIKTMVISLLLILSMPIAKLSAQVSTWDGTWEPWTHGTGTEADPFLIENAQQLAYLAYRVNNGLDASGGHVSNHNLHYKLMVDVDLNGSETFQWTPIGYWNGNYYSEYFGGNFDGNGHVVSGVYINSSDYWVGFFSATNGANILNLTIDGIISTTHTEYHGIQGVGGIVGGAIGTNISNCVNKGVLNGCCCGGLVGAVNGGIIKITNCYNIGTVNGIGLSGGIMGADCKDSNVSIHIMNCYNTGDVSGSSYMGGGIIGGCLGSSCFVKNCYYLITCGGNNQYGEPKTESYMKSSEFVDVLNEGSCSWDSDNSNTNNGYPVLTMMSYSAATYQATEIATTSATLHGSVYIEHTNAVSKGFEYRKVGDVAYTSISIANNSNYFSHNLSGLDTNTTYEYRTFLKVANCDITTYGQIQTFELSWLNNDTIPIYNVDMLRWVSEQCNSGTTFQGKYVKLMNDIVLPENVPNNMTSIGSYPNYPFKGTFDGNGKLIYNLYIDQPNTPYQGFFGYTLNANLFNVGLVNITASGRNYTGGMVAYAENTHMRDCYVNGGTLFALSYCGGLVGYQEQGTNSIISGCYNTCEVTGNNYVGGLIGFSNYSTVRNSYVAGRVSAQGEPVGAIIGGANEVLMYYCYFSIELTGQTNAIGWNNIGKDGGEGMTNAQMRDPQFVNTLNQNLATPVWMADYATHINNGFPIIKWQRPGTGMEEHDAAKNYISLYPNPAIDFVSIQSNDSSISLKHIEVYDVTGRKVMSEALDGQSQELSVAKLLSGVYHVRVQTSNGCFTNLKLVVQ